jgi:AraC-like DNA-binding protein
MLTIDSHFVRAALRQSQTLGIDSENLLKELGISEDIFKQRKTRVHVDQFVGLVRQIWELSGDEAFGLTGQKCKRGHFEMMARYVHQFETLDVLIQEVCRFYNATRDDFSFKIDIDDNRVGFLVELAQPQLDPDHFLTAFLLCILHRFFCWITDQRIPLLETVFSFPAPEHVKSYQEFFPGVCRFDGPCSGFFFNKMYLELRNAKSWRETKSFLAESPAGLIGIPGSDDSATASVKGIILSEQKKGTGMPDFAFVASKLCLTQQTLRRKLLKEGTSYQQIKDVIRCDIAIDKLVSGELSVSEIGFQLGFVEASSFTRAFKHWTGVSPAEYRLYVRKSS